MKTIEDKAKAYDEVVNKLRHFIAKGVDTLITRADVQDFFPELAESEDEKIRKWIINEIKIKHHNLDEENVDFVDKAIAWLEKQGEKLPVGFYYVNSEGKKFYSDTFKYGDVILHVEKQGEQKPADKVEPKFKVGDKIYLKPEYRMPDDDTPIANTVKEIRRIDDKHYRFDGSYIFIEDQDKYELVVQKPAWSDEDERLCQCLIEDQEEALNKVNNDKYGHSEIISDLKEMYHERIDWLKSLRPQNQWKPSDEQMDALAWALSLAKNCGEECAFDLRTLHEQLKKLKEE